MSKYLNPVHVVSACMSNGGLAKNCTCLKETIPECLSAILGVKDEFGVPVYGITKCGYDCAIVYTQNIPKRLFLSYSDPFVLLTSERHTNRPPRKRRYRTIRSENVPKRPRKIDRY